MQIISHTTQPIWDVTEKIKFASLSTNEQTEVCVIGAGIAGLSIAYQLLMRGKKVILLESKYVGYGETGKSSAHLFSALDDRFYNIEKMHGKQKTKLAAQSHTEAINLIETIIKKEQIECDFKRLSGYLFTEEQNNKILKKEYLAAHRAGLTLNFSHNALLGDCLNFMHQARIQPIRYIQGLVKAVLNLGGKIFEQSTVTKIDFKKNLATVNEKFHIQAHDIVTATNAPLFGNLKMHSLLNPQRTYVISLLIPKNTLEDALFWDNCNPYHYVRLEKYDDQFDLMLVGGEDHRVGCFPQSNPYDNLRSWAKKQFKLNDIITTHQWSGQILEPVDYLAYIGRHPKSKNVFMITGDSGHGLTHATIAAMIIPDLILTGHSPYAELYDSQRKLPLSAIPKWLNNITASMRGYLQYLIPHWHQLPALGTGKILQKGFKKIAVFHEAPGKIKQCTAICSHLKAVLQWNPIEKTWDCPAHGSRFDTEGKFLNGPTCQELKCRVDNSNEK